MATKEVWKTVSINKHYEVSNQGRVRSIDRWAVNSLGQRRFFKGKMLSLLNGPGGYKTVHLGRGMINKYVHHLVMDAFIGKPPPGLQRLHKDDDKNNNHLNNLKFGTYTDNYNDAVKNEKHSRGEKNHNCKLSTRQVLEILKSDEPSYRLAYFYNVSPTTIRDIKARRKWTWINVDDT